MRDWIIAFISLLLFLFGIKIIMMDMRIRNLEQSAKRIEHAYDAVIAENEKLIRMSDQSLRLVTEGGWDAVVSNSAAH